MKTLSLIIDSTPSWKTAALLCLTIVSSGCSGGTASPDKMGKAPLQIGVLFIGARDDYGYNQAHADGAAALKKLEGVKVSEEERVPDTADCIKTMQGMIEQDGARVIFPTSFGYYDPHVLLMARQYPDVLFIHCGGLWEAKNHPKNISSYFGFIDECQYLSGIVAGHTTKTKKLGFVAGKPIPQVLRNINAFTMGARRVNPDITCTVVFTGDWSLPVKEAEATSSLADQGVDVITCHVNSPKVVIENAEKRNIWTCGYHCNQSALAPKGYLTGAEWNWAKVYTDYVTAMRAGQPFNNYVRGGLIDGFVRTSPYGPAVSEAAKKDADAAKALFMEDKFVLFKGPLKDNKGNVVIPEGKAYPQKATELESMNYLVEGVIGH